MPKTPERWLEEINPEKRQGMLKLFLGYAPGVGRTYNMLRASAGRAAVKVW
jgi:two-component system, OmpR family, sensor histidine kinase KdpD